MSIVTYPNCEMQIDLLRGVIHVNDRNGQCALRITGVPKPVRIVEEQMLDVHVRQAICSWEEVPKGGRCPHCGGPTVRVEEIGMQCVNAACPSKKGPTQ